MFSFNFYIFDDSKLSCFDIKICLCKNLDIQLFHPFIMSYIELMKEINENG